MGIHVECLAANSKVVKVLGSVSASYDTVAADKEALNKLLFKKNPENPKIPRRKKVPHSLVLVSCLKCLFISHKFSLILPKLSLLFVNVALEFQSFFTFQVKKGSWDFHRG